MSKRVFVTGAGSGLGRALALRWARAGSHIAIADINSDGAAETLALVQDAGSDGVTLTLDVRNADDWRLARDRLQEEWGGIDVLVNNAGVASGSSLLETSMEDWQWMLDINLMGVIRGCHAFVPGLVAQGSGHVVNIASFAGIAQLPGMISYNVAKTGVISLSETLRGELLDSGVGVSVACPSFFQTNLMNSFRGNPGSKAWVNRVMAKATVTADDVAGDIVDAVDARRFLVITHPEARWHYRFKRLSPEGYFRQMMKTVRQMGGMNKRNNES